jgi:hypothetical protein
MFFVIGGNGSHAGATAIYEQVNILLTLNTWHQYKTWHSFNLMVDCIEATLATRITSYVHYEVDFKCPNLKH